MNAAPGAAGRPAIAPVAGDQRPVWSVMIPTYESGDYLADALRSVLVQDPGQERMQVEVVDDHSVRDDPEALVREVAGDRVAVARQPRNVGNVANFNTCLARARGHLVHLLHGDDAVRPGFYAALERPLLENPDLGAAFCRYISIDERGRWQKISALERPTAGVLEGWLERIATGQRLQPPAMVVRRAVYERLGGFDRRVRRYGEDWEMWTRIAAHYPVWFEPEPLALYRIHTTSISASSVRSGENMRDLERVVAINREVLPPDRADALSRAALRAHAGAALRRGHRMVQAGAPGGAARQAREAVRASRSPRVVAGAVLLLARAGRHAGTRRSSAVRVGAGRGPRAGGP